jgi:DNA-binding transcriptional ArsR family regulator
MTETTDPDADALVRAIAHARRREIIELLAERREPDENVGREELRRGLGDGAGVAIELRHAHIPKLCDVGAVVRTDGGAAIAPGPAFEQALDVVESVPEN